MFLLRPAVPAAVAVVPRAGRLCHGRERVSVGNGMNVCQKQGKMQQGVNSCKRELLKFSEGARGLGGITQEERLFLSQSV